MEEVDYDDWYPEVPPIMDTKQLAELVHTNEQIIRAGAVKEPSPNTDNQADANTPSYVTNSSTGS